ncbi:hypothetical protein FQN60_014663 [Etheostoma spectabile]|uniref:Uncharacterized protein n=1 Tax=Etheostoma spectabile TaxID=54343 RepID=A0A5J5CSP4_9PERO|nr:hypothetical protein FQN60_014663 [Etheostoma spectabile]
MAFQGTLVWLYSLAAQDDSSSPNDCLKTDLVEELSAKLKTAKMLSRRIALKPKFPKMEAWRVSQLTTGASANRCAAMVTILIFSGGVVSLRNAVSRHHINGRRST